MDILPGQIVLSKAGRDQGKVFIVLKVSDDRKFVYIADGILRKVENPKKKKIKHLDMKQESSQKIADKLREGKSIQNSEIAKELRQLLIQV